ncbi:MAG: T9SS type A sorting domain-containing protein [Bacteroidota bacterium]
MTSVSDEETSHTLVVYPNPAESVLSISGLSYAASFSITDVLARPLLTGTTSGDIDITLLARGSYVLTLMQGGEARSVRFVKE